MSGMLLEMQKDSPLCLYPLDEPAGVLPKSYGTIAAHASSVASTPVYGVSSRFGRTIDFDGVDDAFGFGNTMGTLHQGSFTLTAWVRPDSGGETAGRILNRRPADGASHGWGFYAYHNAGVATNSFGAHVLLAGAGGTNGVSQAATGTVVYGVWQHWAATYNASGDRKIYLFHNGEAVPAYDSGGQVPTTGTATAVTTGEMIMGEDQAGLRAFDGSMAYVGIYNYVLSAERIRAYYRTGSHAAVVTGG